MRGSYLVGGLIALALTALATWAFGMERGALWQVVRACVADKKLTGSPLPCLDVDLTAEASSTAMSCYAIRLTGDTILAPTRKVIGVEDPFLYSRRGAELFRCGLARSLFPSRRERKVARSRSRRTRRQLRRDPDAGPASHPYRLPGSRRAERGGGNRAATRARRMGASRRDHSPFGVLGHAHQSGRPRVPSNPSRSPPITSPTRSAIGRIS